jgi:hypothetical protein
VSNKLLAEKGQNFSKKEKGQNIIQYKEPTEQKQEKKKKRQRYVYMHRS